MTPRRPSRRPTFSWLALIAAALAAAALTTGCSSIAQQDATDGGQDAGDRNQPPFTVQLTFTSSGDTPAFIYQGCLPELRIIQLDGQRDVSPTFFCGCSCDDSSCQGGVACGACLSQAQEISPTASYDYTWYAVSSAVESRGTWSCLRSSRLPAGAYRATILVYAGASDAQAHTGARMVSIDFTLPAAAPVQVDLAPLTPAP